MSSSSQPAPPLLVAVLSDTHGLFRPEVLDALRGSDLILHAGDVGRPEVLRGLEAIAPLFAVRGNVDHGAWAEALPLWEVVTAGEHRIYMLHDLQQLDLDPAAAGFSVVVSGHTHRPRAERRAGVLYLNPGSAGPRRFKLPVSIARLRITGSVIEHELVELESIRSV